MNSTRRVAVIAGALFITAAATSIMGLILYEPILNDPDYITEGSANDARVTLGAFFELLLAFAATGTSITLFPIVRNKMKV
jgi:Domain of unknown function (DUF4386)